MRSGNERVYLDSPRLQLIAYSLLVEEGVNKLKIIDINCK
jgi:hypothetical protein